MTKDFQQEDLKSSTEVKKEFGIKILRPIN